MRLIALVRGKTSNSQKKTKIWYEETTNFALSRCRKSLDVLNRLGVIHECDGRTDGQTLSQQMPQLKINRLNYLKFFFNFID